ncbi:hypothetical protein [Erythrobacter sp. MTPC3]|uniref:hypothetical protein n=1 Tax=Erythrobacter sp. MTPC3 TaxID=3056564 RepID=UPI0036F43EF3
MIEMITNTHVKRSSCLPNCRLGAQTESRLTAKLPGNFCQPLTPLGDLRHRIAFGIIAKPCGSHLGLLSAPLGQTTSEKLEAI